MTIIRLVFSILLAVLCLNFGLLVLAVDPTLPTMRIFAGALLIILAGWILNKTFTRS
jgi:uncharacterized membrane protein YraQ (UPF0718 family)